MVVRRGNLLWGMMREIRNRLPREMNRCEFTQKGRLWIHIDIVVHRYRVKCERRYFQDWQRIDLEEAVEETLTTRRGIPCCAIVESEGAGCLLLSIWWC